MMEVKKSIRHGFNQIPISSQHLHNLLALHWKIENIFSVKENHLGHRRWTLGRTVVIILFVFIMCSLINGFI